MRFEHFLGGLKIGYQICHKSGGAAAGSCSSSVSTLSPLDKKDVFVFSVRLGWMSVHERFKVLRVVF